jgi:hypothetical protein
VVKSERKRLLGRPRLRWVDIIKMHLREIGWGGMVERVIVNTAMNLGVL